jgi:hypothetical protein
MSGEKKKDPILQQEHGDVPQSTSSEQKHYDSEKTFPAHDDDLPVVQQLTVEELYNKEKYDLSTMEPGNIFVFLQ